MLNVKCLKKYLYKLLRNSSDIASDYQISTMNFHLMFFWQILQLFLTMGRAVLKL